MIENYLQLESEEDLEVLPEPEFLDTNFPEQAAFIRDPAKLKAAICTRRSGKSYGGGLYLFETAWRIPGCSVLYIALTRDSAKKIIWKDVFKPISRHLGLGAKFNESDLTVTINGSVVYTLGVDSTEDEKDKLLGQKYALVVIDEAAKYTIDLHELIFGVLKPAVADYRGTICLIGTPSNLKKGPYFELTKGQDPMSPGTWEKNGFSCHRWSAQQNPYMRNNWAAEIVDLKRINPRIEETPLFQQHYLGRWVVDDSRLVYKYQPGRNEFDGKLPQPVRGAWHYVLGVDLGYEDDTSFVVGAYHDHLHELYLLEATKQKKLDVTSVANRIKALQAKYDIERTLVDNANKQAVEEMKQRHGLALTPADKRGKWDFIQLMNGEFISETIKLGPHCGPLKEEYAELIEDDRSSKPQEHPACANHCADGALYLWRFCYPYLSEALKSKNQVGTAEYLDEQSKALEDAARKRLQDRLAFDREDTSGVSNSENWDISFQ